MLLVSGLDLVLVGRFEFAVVAPYSVSASMAALISGLLYAVIDVIMPRAAVLHARQNASELGKLVISWTRNSLLLLILTGLPLLICARPILRLWIGQRYVAGGAPLLATLIIANIIRLAGASYSVVMAAAGQQRYVKVSPLAEGVSNFVASIVLGSILGGIGVALGTLLGSIVSVASHFWYSMPRTKAAISFSRRDFVVSSVLTPLLYTSPLLAFSAASLRGFEMRPLTLALAVLLSCIGAGLLIFRASKELPASDHESPVMEEPVA
jgi:O-antigen/teichoic acid export membrane protein